MPLRSGSYPLSRLNIVKKISINGNYANRNYGDLLMLDLVSRHLQKTFGARTQTPWVLSESTPYLNVHRIGGGIMSHIGVNSVIFGGGGYLNGQTKKADQVRRLKRHARTTQLLRLLRIPFMISGIGARAESSETAANLTRDICRGAELVSVRDEITRETLIRIGIEPERIRVLCDLVMAMTGDDIADESRNRARDLLGDTSGHRLFGLHVPHIKRDPEVARGLMRAAGNAFASHPDVLPVFFFDSPGKSEPVLRPLAEEYFKKWKMIPFQENHWDTAAIIAEMNGVLTTKLHVGITAWALGIMPCAYAGNEKTARFFDQIGRSGFYHNLEDDPSDLATWINLFCSGSEDYFSEDSSLRAKLINLAHENYRLIDQFVEKHD